MMAASSSSKSSSSSSSSWMAMAAATATGIMVGITVTVICKNRLDNHATNNINNNLHRPPRHHAKQNRGMLPQPQNQHQDPSSSSSPSSSKPSSLPRFPLELRQEQLSRHTLFFGPDGMKRLQKARICVVGAGGVGSHTVCSLIRAGIGYVRVIDFDQVSLSSLNRHACATLAHVGTPKTTCLVEYAQQLCPDSQYLVVEGRCDMYTAETSAQLLDLTAVVASQEQQSSSTSSPTPTPKWDWIVDAIDDVPTKAHLIYTAWKMGVRVVSCMGAGGKADFTRLHVSDLQSASRDPLASKLRQCLKKQILQPQQPQQQQQQGDNNKTNNNNNNVEELFQNAEQLAIVFSSEKVVQKLADLTPEQKDTKSSLAASTRTDGQGSSSSGSGGVADEYGAVPGMRIRVLPVLGTLPAIMGQSLAAWVLTELAEQPFQPVTGERVGRNVRNKLIQKLQTREDRFLRRMLEQHNITDPKRVEQYKKDGGFLQWPLSSSSAFHQNQNQIQQEKTDEHDDKVWIGPLQIDADDVEYLMEVWRNRCAVTGARLGTVLELVRWDEGRLSTCDNLILLSQHAKQAWDQTTADAKATTTTPATHPSGDDNKPSDGQLPIGRRGLDPQVRRKIEARLATCRVDSRA
ncbi:hypothetical protein ACA910_018044 [Epithemia clementina (nom. ined.)]